jgi:hypothetical protein
MFQVFHMFRGMLQVLYIDVIKVDQDAAYVCNDYTCMFQVYVANVLSVRDECCRCFVLILQK